MAKAKLGKRKNKSKNSTTPRSHVEPKAAARLAPVMGEGEGENLTVAACIKRPRTTEDNNDSIPTEILFNIFLLLPASMLQDIVRLVCKEWNAIISDPLFIRAHLCRSLSSSSLGFLVQDNGMHDAKLKRAFYLHKNYNSTRYSLGELELPFKAAVLGSCNGLVLLQDAMVGRQLFVVNLVTKAKISLPPLKLAPGVRVLARSNTSLAFAPSSGQYKVVHVSFVSNHKAEGLSAKYELKTMVCTVAVDKTWRAIDSKGITNYAEKTLMCQPLSSEGGYIYWFDIRDSYGLALDMDAETMHRFAPPERLLDELLTYGVKMDTGSVGMVHLQRYDKHWKVWELIEPKTGTWGSRAMDFDAACMYSALESHFNPTSVGFALPLLFSWKTGELWLICNRCLVCYNWKTGSIWSPPIRWPRVRPFPPLVVNPHLHVNSLLSLKNV